MAVGGGGGSLLSMDLMKFLKILLGNRRSDFEVSLKKFSFGDPFQILGKICSIKKYGPGGRGCLHFTDMTKFSKIFFSEIARQILK